MRVWLTGVLAVGAAVAVGFGMSLALAREDAEALETPLLLAVARQLQVGPWELYGPFGGWNPLVLIHGPLYYHLAALVAWPLAGWGIEPVTAALLAGRSLSIVGLGWTLAALYRVARLDGTTQSAGWWAALLVAASPVVDAMPFAVRPDMLGVALQTTGVLLVLSALRSERPSGWMLPVAFAAFALALCIKQHFFVGPVISTGLLLAAWRRGRLAFKFIERGLLTGVAIVLVVHGAEEMASSGKMSQAVFRAAGHAARIHPADWIRAGVVMSAIVGKSSGLIALLTAAGLAVVGSRQGRTRRIFATAAGGLVGLIFVLTVVQIGYDPRWITIVAVAALFFSLVLVVPACAFLEPRMLIASPVDRALLLYLAGELLLVSVLCKASTGAWVNYGIQAVVFVAALTARALARAFQSVPSVRPLLPVALAALIVLIDAIESTGTKPTGVGSIEPLWRRSSIILGVLRPSSSSPTVPVTIVFTANQASRTTNGFTQFSSRCTWPSRDRSGSGKPSRPARSDLSSEPPIARISTASARHCPRAQLSPSNRGRSVLRLGARRFPPIALSRRLGKSTGPTRRRNTSD